jgi:DNA modification methylase
VEQLKHVPDASVDFSVFSPPFQSLFTYSASDRDMGNSLNQAQFFEHYQFFLAELYRVFKPGRIVACHVSQVAATLAHDGFIGIQDFRGKVIDSFTAAGFHYYGDVTVDKNPQAQAIRTHAKGLLFAQLKKDASWLRPGLADYILIFRKPGENEVPIHPDISNDDWIQWAHPVWYDIRESNTLNVAVARENNDERHICPLQLGLIERCIRLWSNPGETVLSPFMGIGSEGYEAILLGRKFIGVELKDSYYRTAIKNLAAAHAEVNQQRLL